jgi:hypothetical protein
MGNVIVSERNCAAFDNAPANRQQSLAPGDRWHLSDSDSMAEDPTKYSS